MISVNEKALPIDYAYFKNYGGGDFSEKYIEYTIPASVIISELYENNLPFETLLDIGCASGELVRDFRNLGIKAYGIENNKEILIRSIFPQYCVLMDMKDLSSIKKNSFDVVYSNSFMYLFPQEVLQVLKGIHRIVKKAVYLSNPFLEEAELTPDPYRKFLASRNWWDSQFKEAGFFKVSDTIFVKK